jgi:hypothetical protein
MKPAIFSSSIFRSALLTLFGVFLFTGCATTKDAVNRKNVDDLKTAHLAFIDEFTEGAGKTWDDEKLATRKAALESQFVRAERHAATTNDSYRSKALSNVHSRFKKHVATLERQKAFFSPTYAAGLKSALTMNYDQALRGEDVR